MKKYALAAAAVMAVSATNANAIQFYVGADLVDLDLSQFSQGPAGSQVEQRADFESSMWRLRAGYVFNENFNLELQAGADNAEEADGELELDSYYGVFLVPHAAPVGNIDISVPIGYSITEFTASAEEFKGISFGINIEVPLSSVVGIFWDSAEEVLPDVRFSVGYMNYLAEDEETARGANIGVKYQFGFGED